MQTSNVTQKGQITVPSDLRKELGIKAGGKVRFTRKGRGVLVEAIDEPEVDSLFGILKAPKGFGVTDVDTLVEAAMVRRAKGLNRRKDK